MKRKLARPGDRIIFEGKHGMMKGLVTKRLSDYLFVKLDEPRVVEDWEHTLVKNVDPYQTTVYLRSDYQIEEAENG